MTAINIKCPSCCILIVILVLLLSGCASFGPTEPNIPFAGNHYPSMLIELARKNPLLVQELGKLPEIQDGVSESEASALEHIVEIHEEIPEDFDDAFNQMYKIGNPDVRKYCSPLQAVFWLAEGGRVDDARGILEHYSLDELLHTAWPSKKSVLTEYQTLDIIDGMKNEKEREEYGERYSKIGNSKKLWSHLLIEYLVEPDKFSEKGQRSLATLMKPPKPLKEEEWEDFNTVVERVNSLELFDYWVNNTITYGDPRVGYTKPATKTFKDKKGDCSDIAELGQTILDQAGYNVIKICTFNHVMAYGKEDGFYWLAIDFTKVGNRLKGPFENIHDLYESARGPILPCGRCVEP